jgi:hypothetical protein
MWTAQSSGQTHVAEPGDWRIRALPGDEERCVSYEVSEQLSARYAASPRVTGPAARSSRWRGPLGLARRTPARSSRALSVWYGRA